MRAPRRRSARDAAPAVGRPGGPAAWTRAADDAEVAVARPAFGDARWSFLFGPDTGYGTAPQADEVAEANRRGRGGPPPDAIQGPFLKPPVWTWEVPLYFWAGGVAAGAAFVALACDLAGDGRSARTARQVALGAVAPAPLLLIADLGRPARFLNMLRVVKPRSPMNMGAWALVAFSALDGAAVAADLAGRPRTARPLGAATAVVGGYLGSYTGVLLATTAVPLWARSRLLLGPIFVATATATGAAATRLALVARGLPAGHPTRTALGTLETGAMLTELTLSTVNELRLGDAAAAMRRGRPGRLFALARAAVATGLLLRFARARAGPWAHHVASGLYLGGGLAFRYAWMAAGKASAGDDAAVARMARGRLTAGEAAGDGGPPAGARVPGAVRAPLRRAPVGRPLRRAWSESLRRASLAIERRVRR